MYEMKAYRQIFVETLRFLIIIAYLCISKTTLNMKRLLILGTTLFSLLTPTMAKTKTVNIRVIQTSDVHGCFFPFDFISRKPKEGTLARVSTYVNRLRTSTTATFCRASLRAITAIL